MLPSVHRKAAATYQPKGKHMDKQSTRILKHLQRGNTINPMQALKLYQCFRLAARIYDLKEAGHDIKKTMVTRNGKRYARYSL